MYIAAILTLYLMFHTYKPKKEKKLKNEAKELNGNVGSSSSDLKRASTRTKEFKAAQKARRSTIKKTESNANNELQPKDTMIFRQRTFDNRSISLFSAPLNSPKLRRQNKRNGSRNSAFLPTPDGIKSAKSEDYTKVVSFEQEEYGNSIFGQSESSD